MTPNSLYIHIPFCQKICPYCDFIKTLDVNDFKERYVNEIIKDISFLFKEKYQFKTIYIGGGTPSILTVEQLRRLLLSLKKLLKDDYEFTIEANPESLNEDKLRLFKEYGINRISIGIQSFDKEVLKKLERDFNIDYFELIKTVKKYINNINVDFIYGLPNQTFESIKNDLNKFIELDISHISTYSLILEKGTKFFNEGVKEVDDELSRKYYDFILSFLRNCGFKRYEVSNFCKPGYESKHNLTYRKDNEYVAIGIGASGYENKIRYENSSSLTKYLKGIRDRKEEAISESDALEYYFICNLRLEEGFKLRDFENRFGFNFKNRYKVIIQELISRKLVDLDEESFKCTDEGIMLLDRVLLELLSM